VVTAAERVTIPRVKRSSDGTGEIFGGATFSLRLPVNK
jgi:triacylglycerol lipase